MMETYHYTGICPSSNKGGIGITGWFSPLYSNDSHTKPSRPISRDGPCKHGSLVRGKVSASVTRICSNRGSNQIPEVGHEPQSRLGFRTQTRLELAFANRLVSVRL